MKLFIILLASLSFSSSITISTTNSPFIIDTTLTVDTLIIKENANIFLNAGAGIIVEKYLFSVGSFSAPITFSSGESSPTPYDWNGITISSSGAAFFINNNFSHCINCITSLTKTIIIDSSTFKDFGENKVIVSDSIMESTNSDYFAYNNAQWPVKKITAKKKNKKWMLWTAAGLISIPIALLLPRNGDNNSPETPNNNEDIKHPNLPTIN